MTKSQQIPAAVVHDYVPVDERLSLMAFFVKPTASLSGSFHFSTRPFIPSARQIQESPIVREGLVGAATILPLSLVFDHRVLDGAYAARFLSRFMHLAAHPQILLSELR